MLFPISKLSALLLAAYTTASPLALVERNPKWQDMEVIGYRTCDKVEADNYEDTAKPIKPDFLYNKKDQIGEGVYTSPAPGEWRSVAYPTPRYCIIVADPDAFKDHPKVWIPESQWDKPEEYIANWITQQGLDAKAALRLSKIGTGNQGDKFQMLIPRWLTATEHDTIGLYAQCWESVDLMPMTDRIDYADWDNVKGDSQLGSDSDSSSDSDDD
ncbi:hypothetical protein F4809DRAFT_382086 [Biscogniauxia mediterranea]|nr:hypothetical protein F4809DRAFT_382086 [Biscogniauxia mediterranea]